MTCPLLMTLLVLAGPPVDGTSLLAEHGYGFVQIEPGDFLMGSPDDEPGRNVDETQHSVQITKPFEMGVFEVSGQLYKAVVDDPFRETSSHEYPVRRVTWFEAISFCVLLSLREGLEPAYRIEGESVFWDQEANGFRLPTEAEWEYAARAGGTTLYAGADRVEDLASFDENSPQRLHVVGENKANAWGLHDMTGNVSEWCWDGYADYPQEKELDPIYPPEGHYRVVRGGSYASGPHGRLRVACRERGDAGIRSKDRGFRIVRSLVP